MPAAKTEATVLGTLINALEPLSVDARKRLLQTVATFYDLASPAAYEGTATGRPAESQVVNGSSKAFSTDRSASPKDFIHEKAPDSETERIVCLAFYLAHYRGQQHFKTLDLTQLNTEAAQIKFSNASAIVHTASRQGLIGPAPNGQRQITARGERFVSMLPDREAARAALAGRSKKRKPNGRNEG